MVFVCKYCNKVYKQEPAFNNHTCKQMVRHAIHGTIEGQIAFALYEKWTLRRHGTKVELDLFKISRHYKPLLKFAKYFKNIKGLIDLDDFINLMVQLDMPPMHWNNEKVLSYYFTELDNLQPIEKIQICINSLIKLSGVYNCDVKDVFNDLEFDTLVSMLRMHRLTPWVLLNSKKFINWIAELPWEQQYLMDNVIDVDKWKAKFKEDGKSLEFAKLCVKEIEI